MTNHPAAGPQSPAVDAPAVPGALRGVLAVVGATFVMAFGFGALGLTSVFMAPLESQFGWSRADTSLVYGLATIGMALGGVFWGRLFDRLDLRVLLAIGGAGMAASLLSMSAVQTLWQLYLANIVLAGLGFSVLYAPLLAISGEWFSSRRGLVTGIVTAGGALGQGLMPFIASLLITSSGWRLAYLYLGIATLAVLVLILPAIRRPGAVVPGASAPSLIAAHADEGYRRKVSLLATAAFFCCACMGVPLVHLANFVGSICGSPTLGATSLLVAMVFGAMGRISFGLLADRTGALASYAAASSLQTACVFIYPLLADSASLLAVSAVFGFGFAGNMTCLVLCVREAAPANRFGGAIGAVMFVAWAGMASGGYLGGQLFVIYLSYTLPFLAAGISGLMNLVTLVTLHETSLKGGAVAAT